MRGIARADLATPHACRVGGAAGARQRAIDAHWHQRRPAGRTHPDVRGQTIARTHLDPCIGRMRVGGQRCYARRGGFGRGVRRHMHFYMR